MFWAKAMYFFVNSGCLQFQIIATWMETRALIAGKENRNVNSNYILIGIVQHFFSPRDRPSWKQGRSFVVTLRHIILVGFFAVFLQFFQI